MYAMPMPAPADVEAGHFHEGDRVQFGRGESELGVVTDTQLDHDGCIRLHLADRDVRTRPANLLHIDGCPPCEEFKQAWAAEQERLWQEERSDYTPAARELADTLRDRGLLQVSTTGLSCGHGDDYIVEPDAPLPSWLHTVLKGVVFTAPEGPWPNWGRTDHPINWPALLEAHPDTLAAEQDMLDWNEAGSWESIAHAFTLLRSIDPDSHIDVFLWVSTTGLITIEPTGFWAHSDIPADVASQVDDILVAGGRDRDSLHDRVWDDQGTFAPRRGWLLGW